MCASVAWMHTKDVGCTLRACAQPVHAGTLGCGAGAVCARPGCW